MFSSNAAMIEQLLTRFAITVKLAMPEQVRYLVNDTRALQTGDIFCAVNGTVQKGSAYLGQALASNCHLILLECEHAADHGKVRFEKSGEGRDIAIIEFYRLNQQLFALASEFYQFPQQQLTVVGITGTNGKTSTSQMIAHLLSATNKSCAVIGTNGAGQVGQLTAINNTTPGATELMQWLQKFVEQKQQYVAMEVSSHALEQGRVTADLFDVAVFTNLSRDHLDYHQTMANYAAAKFQIFSENAKQTAILNGDDAVAQQWLDNWQNMQALMVYGRGASIAQYPKYVQAKDIKHQANGVSFKLSTHLGEIEVTSRLLGDFNIDNLLAAIAVLINADVSLNDIVDAVSELSPVIGRMEAFVAKGLPLAVVDYAHTPDALANALIACRQHCQGELWVVFGCGGDRDQGKRPLMGAVAEANSDHIIVTNDNPRTEQPEAIAKDILSGCQQADKISVMLDRQQAVLAALTQAKQNDVVLLAGKGHEDYIIVGEQKISYNEREFVRSTYAHGALS